VSGLTAAFEPASGSAIDPLVEEVTWSAWEMTAADPSKVSEGAVQAVNVGFDCLVEAAWRPGRSVLLTDLVWEPERPEPLVVRLGIGVLGSKGSTQSDLAGLVPRVETALSTAGLFSAVPSDPAMLVGPNSSADTWRHAAHITQGSWCVGDDDDVVEIVSRFNPTVEPWCSVAAQLGRLDRSVRVRATVLATELSPADRLELDDALRRVRAIRARNEARAEILFDVERAEATLLDLRASLASPALAGEIAVCSAEPLPETLLRSIAASFTSESDVLRRQGRVVVAANRFVLGGFEIRRDPSGWQDAQRLGVPLRGGLGARNLRDLLTLTESPIGWPVPFNGPLPATPTRVAADRPVPTALLPTAGTAATTIGTTPRGTEVSVPVEWRTRHMVVTGAWGAGKSTLLRTMALDDLRNGRPFLFLDPHGTAADDLIAHARLLGQFPVVIDAADGGTDLMKVLPRLTRAVASRTAADDAARRVAEAIASSLPDPEWSGPRWFAAFEALLELVIVHRGELVDGAVWLNDPVTLRPRLDHPELSPLARSTLETLAGSSGQSADVRGWVTCKLHPLVGGTVRRVLAPVGKGLDIAAAIAAGRPVIVSLSHLSMSEGNLVGHLALASVLDAALARPAAQAPLVTCYVDEAHRFPASGLSRAIAEGRKFGVALAVAGQSLGQWPHEFADLSMAAGTQVVFRATPETASRLAPVVGVAPGELISQPDLHAVVAVHGQPATTVVVPVPDPCPQPRVVAPPRSRVTKRRPTASPSRPSLPPFGPPSRPDLIDDFLARRRAAQRVDPAEPAATGA
jgi:hypothetical protein